MINKSILLAVLIQVIVSYHQCLAVIKMGACPETPTITDFNVTKYGGKWYDISNFPIYFQNGLDCVTAQYGPINSSYVTVTNTGINIATNKTSIINGIARVKDISAPNRLIVTFPIKVFNFTLFSNDGNYDVWATDYVNYSLVYSCTDYDFLFFTVRSETAWILSRTKTLPDGTVNMLNQMLSDRGVDPKNLLQIKQTCNN